MQTVTLQPEIEAASEIKPDFKVCTTGKIIVVSFSTTAKSTQHTPHVTNLGKSLPMSKLLMALKPDK